MKYIHIKRLLDFFFAIGLLLSCFIPLLFLLLISYFDTRNCIFLQKRIGKDGKTFYIYKIRTISKDQKSPSNIGRIMRKYKWDELPQLINIIKGEMSFVGPRPDVPGYYDLLEGESRKILRLRPGLISRAAFKYFNEEDLLQLQNDPLTFNNQYIFPDKVRMNLEYYSKHSFREDIKIILFFLKHYLLLIILHENLSKLR